MIDARNSAYDALASWLLTCDSIRAVEAALDAPPQLRDDAIMPPRPPVLPNLRQPLCPYCEYNLTGVFDRTAMRAVRCPECGESMEPHELHWTRRKGDWTLATGLRNTAAFVLKRSALVALLLAASAFAAEGLAHLLQRVWLGFPLTITLLILIVLPTGIACGRLLTRGFEEAAGYFGLLQPTVATIALMVAGLLVVLALPAVMTFVHAPVNGMTFMACAVAAVVILIEYLSEAA